MHDPELLRCAQYNKNNGPPDDLYIIPTTYALSASPGAVNNFPTFSRRLKTIRYPKDFKSGIQKYDGRSDPSIWLKMYNIACASGATKTTWWDTSHLDGQSTTPVPRHYPSRAHHLLGNFFTTLHNQLLGDLQPSWKYSSPR
jgi:hypothetical protein